MSLKVLRLIFFLLALLTFDRYIKLTSLQGNFTAHVGFLDFSPSINTSWLFGLINNYSWLIVLVGLVLFLVIKLLVKVLQNNQLTHAWGWGLILIGGISNYWDRLWYGGVIDFVNFSNLSQFNFSDIYLIIGLSILILNSKTIHVS